MASKKKGRLCNDDETFANFAKLLVEAEMSRCGLHPSNGHSTVLNNYPDGGVDYLVTERPLTQTEWLGNKTVFQFKFSLPTLAKLKAEIGGPPARKDEPSRPSRKKKGKTPLEAFLRDGGDYRVVIDGDAEPLKVERLERELRTYFDRRKFLGAIKVHSVSRWAQTHLSMLNRLPDAPACASTFRSWTQWREDRELALQVDRLPWTDDEPRKRAREELCQRLLPGSLTRVEGPPGAGKSRFVLEALSERQREVCYLDQFPHDYQALIAFCRRGLFGVLVIDECDDEQHRLLKSMVREGIAIVTIGATGSTDVRPAEDALRVDVLEEGAFDRLAAAMGTSFQTGVELALRLARRCGRYVKLLRLVLEAAASVPEERFQSEPDIRRALLRLLGATHDTKIKALSLLALPVSFDEADRSCLAKAQSLDIPAVEGAMRSLRQRALLGGFEPRDREGTERRYVTPRLLAEWLAIEAWGDEPFALLERITRSKPPPKLVEKIFRQLLLCPGLEPIRQKLLGDPERLRALIPLEGLRELAEALALRFPAETNDFVRRLLRGLTTVDGAQFQGVIRLLAWSPDLFESCAGLLAEMEARPKFIAELFGTVLGLTQAPAEARLKVLSDWAQAPNRRRLALVCAAEATGRELSRGLPHPELDLSRNWHPRTNDEEHGYRLAAARVIANLLREPEAREEAQGEAVQRLDELIREGFLPVAAELAKALDQSGVRRSVIRSVFLRFAKFEHLTDEDKQVLVRVLDELAPKDLEERVAELCGRFETPSEDEMKGLASAIVDNPAEAVVSPLFDGAVLMAFEFGEAIGALDPERQVLEPLLRLARATPFNRALCGYLSKLSGEPTADDLLDGWSTESGLSRLVFDATRVISHSPRGASRLLRLFKTGIAPSAWLGELRLGAFLARIPIANSLELLNSLELAPELRLGLLFQCRHISKDERFDPLLFDAWHRVPASALSHHTAWEWMQTLELFQSERAPELAAKLADALCDDGAALALKDDIRRLDDRIQQLTLQCLEQRDVPTPLLRGAFRLDDMIDWALDWSRDQPRRIALLAALADGVSPGGILDRLLERDPGNADLRSHMLHRLHSGLSWRGEVGLATSLEARCERLIQHATRPTRALAKSQLSQLKARSAAARRRSIYERETGDLLMLAEGSSKWTK